MDIIYYLDFKCPFCYMGLSQLEEAIESFDEEVNLSFHSFVLADPTSKKLMGDVHKYKESFNVRIKPKKPVKFNTFLAHQTLHAINEADQLNFIKDAYELVFEEQQKLDEKTLQPLWEKYNVTSDEVMTDEMKDKVLTIHQEAVKDEVEQIPVVVIDDQYAVVGAQRKEGYLKAMEQAKAGEV